MAKGKGFGGFGGGMNMQAMMKQAQKMQESMLKAQEEIAQMESTGTAGGGMVTATVTGTSTLKSIAIKPDVVDPDDIDMLQDLDVYKRQVPSSLMRLSTSLKPSCCVMNS